MIAEFNLGRLRHDWDDPRVAPFVEALERVYALAKDAPGYVWSLPADEMEKFQLDPEGPLGGDPRIASTLSVWQSVTALKAFAHQGVHGGFIRRSAAWFEVWETPRMVLWTVQAGARPTVADGIERLRALERDGPTDFAYDWAHGLAREGHRAPFTPQAGTQGAVP
ncbi:MAG: DUF3291 domain-containing protein [Pseudomonadota bacterium]